MSFFDKLKQSASKATDKAKESVEIVRLNGQISATRKEIEKQYMLIGQMVFEAELKDELYAVKERMAGAKRIIMDSQSAIKELELRIKEIKAVKDCDCGNSLPLDARFCSSCGKKFDVSAEVSPSAAIEQSGAVVVKKSCTSCNAIIDPEDQFCLECGTKVQ